MPKSAEIRQKFVKGINRRFSREDSADPNFFWSLQNARVLSRGESGNAVRIAGFDVFNNADDYGKVLDIKTFRDRFLVFYEDGTTSGQFHIRVFDTSGTIIDTLSYTGEETEEGKLSVSEHTVYISPHNKIVFFDEAWHIGDFIPEVPDITVAIAGTSSKADGSIEVTGAPQPTQGEKAQGYIRVATNNVPTGETEMLTIELAGEITSPIEIDYTDTPEEIALRIAQECDTAFTNYEVSMVPNRPGVIARVKRGKTVYFTAVNEGYSNDRFILTTVYTIGGSVDSGSGRPGGAGQPAPLFGEGGSNPELDGGGGGTNAMGPITGPWLEQITMVLNHPEGTGSDAESDNFGPLFIYIPSGNIVVSTTNILVTDTPTTITDKIESALNNDDAFNDRFTLSRSVDVLTITSKQGGKKYNGPIYLKLMSDGLDMYDATNVFSVTINAMTGGEVANENVSLEQDTSYWYTVRFRYRDGYITPIANPKVVDTGPLHSVEVTVDTSALDIDGTRPTLQVFRRKEEEQFFLIDEIEPSGDTTVYQDLGQSKKSGLDDRLNVFTKSHQCHEVIENRLVKGNLEYFNEEYDSGAYTLTAVNADQDDDKVIPENTSVEVYQRPKYIDGSDGYFESIGSLEVKDSRKKIQIFQQSTPSNVDKEISEIGYYVNYAPHGEKYRFPFNTAEIANGYLPTIASSNVYPNRTQVFFGFKYIEVISGDSEVGIVRVVGWDTGAEQATDHGGLIFSYNVEGTGADAVSGKFPRYITVNIFGTEYLYVRMLVRASGLQSAVYKLDLFDSLQQAVQTGKLRLSMSNSMLVNLSSNRNREELFDVEVKVTGLIDVSTQYREVDIISEDSRLMAGPMDSRLYLQLEDSPLDDIDNVSVNRYGLKNDYRVSEYAQYVGLDGIPQRQGDIDTFTMSFELLNFKLVNDPVYNSYTGDDANYDAGRPITVKYDTTIYTYKDNWDNGDYHLVDFDLVNDDSVIYIGSMDPSPANVTMDITGYEFKKISDLFYSRLARSNLYETLVSKYEVIGEREFNNQIIWGDPIVRGKRFSGGRQFAPESFLNLPADNGELIELYTIGGRLYAFCTRGVLEIFVGEVLTQQKNGQVFVNTSTFLNNYRWILTDLVDIKRKSISRFKNKLFFTDGTDVFLIAAGGQQKNITEGSIPLDPLHQYAGMIDPTNDEYRLADLTDGVTWGYNYKGEQWYGPFTYTFKRGNSIDNVVISDWQQGDLVRHNEGNTFAGQSYETRMESVGNDTNSSAFDKNFRKFYINVENNVSSVFRYGKDPNNMTEVPFSTMRSVHGHRHQGVNSANQNGKLLYWEIVTLDEGFQLQDLKLLYNRKRRI